MPLCASRREIAGERRNLCEILFHNYLPVESELIPQGEVRREIKTYVIGQEEAKEGKRGEGKRSREQDTRANKVRDFYRRKVAGEGRHSDPRIPGSAPSPPIFHILLLPRPLPPLLLELSTTSNCIGSFDPRVQRAHAKYENQRG